MFFVQKEFNDIVETKWGEVGDESKKAEFGDWEKETMDTMLFGWGAQFVKLRANWSCPSSYCLRVSVYCFDLV